MAGMVTGVGYLPVNSASKSASLPKIKKHDARADNARWEMRVRTR